MLGRWSEAMKKKVRKLNFAMLLVSEVAEKYGVTRETVYNWIDDKITEPLKTDTIKQRSRNIFRIDPMEIEEYLNRRDSDGRPFMRRTKKEEEK